MSVVRFFVERYPPLPEVARGAIEDAIKTKRLFIVRYLFESVVPTPNVHHNDDHFLHVAVAANSFEIVRYLLDTVGANIHAAEDALLEDAIYVNNMEMIKYLVETRNGPRINPVGVLDSGAFHAATPEMQAYLRRFAGA